MMIAKTMNFKFQSCFKLLNLAPKRFFCLRPIRKNIIAEAGRTEFRSMTANIFRQEKSYEAVILKTFNASDTIKILKLNVKEPEFQFKAGQWVDLSVSGILGEAGYSMISPPYIAKDKGILELAVKYGKAPITHWIHKNCKEGDKVRIRVGGDFYYEPQTSLNLLLVGGGVGINPMVSISSEYCCFIRSRLKGDAGSELGKIHLLYSAKTCDELVFKDVFSQMESEYPELRCRYFVTKEQKKSENDLTYSRITEEDIRLSINELKVNKTLCYICGPSTMTDEIASWLQGLDIAKENVKYEKWW